MSVRFLANAGRIIMSKAGYDASPALADTNKLFDSNWGATGLVIACGTAVKPAGTTPFAIPFPYPLHYVPAAHAYTGAEDGQGQIGYPIFGYTTNNSLIIDQSSWNISMPIRYIIFAVSI